MARRSRTAPARKKQNANAGARKKTSEKRPKPSKEKGEPVQKSAKKHKIEPKKGEAADKVTLTLYLVLHKDDAEMAVRLGVVSPRHVSPGKPGLIGLRQDPEEARVRYMKIFGEKNQANLVLFMFAFSSAGIARMTTQLTNAEHDFLPKLHKVKYEHQTKDWGVWHFVGDLPLTAPEAMTWSYSRMEETP